jgi:MOSC domain-containing protein YiiM
MKSEDFDIPIKEFISKIPQKGNLEWIGVRPIRKQPLQSVNSVEVNTKMGLEGDHFASTHSCKRQVTLIQKEHLDAVASILGKDSIDPGLTRRNLVISGVNLLALRNMKFHIGEVILEGTGYCHPCSRMEENLGPGGYNAMRGHGGLTAKVIQGGVIKLGDTVKVLIDT